MIKLFSRACLYENDETIVYGQINKRFLSILTNHKYIFIPCKGRSDFLLKIKGKINKLTIVFVFRHTSVNFDEPLFFPFEHCDLELTKNSAIITTMSKNDDNRIEEWIQYNLKLGFSGIVIFNNAILPMNELCKKYKGKVFIVDFPYSPFEGEHWNKIQSISLYIGVNAFRTKCRNIALIDADEFIWGPDNIEEFLKNHSTITIRSNILTNKNKDDILNNNILELARYVGEDKYTKTILHTEVIQPNEFVYTPHEHPTQKILPKNEIIYYHCWMNERYSYDESMPMIKLI